ncbi:MAG: glycosyltransferase, partial [Methylotenera sp.]
MNFTDRPWVAYVGPFSFPEGGAATRRVFGNAKALVAAGYNVVVVSGYAQSLSQQPELLEPGIWSVQINERGSEHLPKVLRYLCYVFIGRQSRKWIDSCDSKPAAIVLYSGYTPYLLQFTRWARRRSIKLIFDAVEWYTAQSALQFLRSPYYWNIEFAMRVLIPRLDGIISISSSLETYYKRHIGCVVSIPPLVDMSSMHPRVEFTPSENGLSIAYSGSPG